MTTITAEIAAMIAWMIATYHAHSAADEYWFGFVRNGLLYVVPNLEWEILVSFFRAGFTSHKKGHKLIIRIRPTADDLDRLMPRAILLGEESLLTRKTKNKGDGLEAVLTERYTAEEWVKHDSTPFFVRGDLRINGKEVQAKLDDATLTTYDFLKKNFG